MNFPRGDNVIDTAVRADRSYYGMGWFPGKAGQIAGVAYGAVDVALVGSERHFHCYVVLLTSSVGGLNNHVSRAKAAQIAGRNVGSVMIADQIPDLTLSECFSYSSPKSSEMAMARLSAMVTAPTSLSQVRSSARRLNRLSIRSVSWAT